MTHRQGRYVLVILALGTAALVLALVALGFVAGGAA